MSFKKFTIIHNNKGQTKGPYNLFEMACNIYKFIDGKKVN